MTTFICTVILSAALVALERRSLASLQYPDERDGKSQSEGLRALDFTTLNHGRNDHA